MAKPLILSDNWCDTVVLRPTFVLANPDADDAEHRQPFRVADNLRDLTSWSTTTTNAQRSLRLSLGAARTDDTIIILDRGHNLGGKTVAWERADDAGFTVSYATIFTATIPSSAGGLPGDANGCLTSEGVWWKTFSHAGSTTYRRLRIPAMGAGLAPIVTGLHVGASYRLPEYLDAPGAYDYASTVTFERNEVSKGGVRVTTRPILRDMLDLRFSLESGDYAAFHTEVMRLLRYGAPWWVCVDDGDATGAGLMRMFRLKGETEYRPVVNPVHREIELALEANVPLLYV